MLLQYGEGSNRIGNIERVCLMLAKVDGKSFDVTGFRLGDPSGVGVPITEMANAMPKQQGSPRNGDRNLELEHARVVPDAGHVP
ncbi:MAG TPA: hypothetical protein VFS12_15630 [Terriglobia bacterium]|nr:hypothetical protein [Terriglobia bacterium]